MAGGELTGSGCVVMRGRSFRQAVREAQLSVAACGEERCWEITTCGRR